MGTKLIYFVRSEQFGHTYILFKQGSRCPGLGDRKYLFW